MQNSDNYFYPIGSQGEAWGTEEKQAWLENQQQKRSYHTEVVEKINTLSSQFDCLEYGELSYPDTPTQTQNYPLFALKTKNWKDDKPNILITGGVHGYETSGVQGALLFAQNHASDYEDDFNFVIVPCVSPWGYEVINRWNPEALDPNRSFFADSPAQESRALMAFVASFGEDFFAHFDLHETTDSDENEFRPALAARDGLGFEPGHIPDGFYTVGDTQNPQPEFQKAIIESVAKVTHIAPADEKNQIIGSDVVQFGVINYPLNALSLCAGVTGAPYTTTTEVYPDSPKASPEICNQAQVAALVGGLDYLLSL